MKMSWDIRGYKMKIIFYYLEEVMKILRKGVFFRRGIGKY